MKSMLIFVQIIELLMQMCIFKAYYFNCRMTKLATKCIFSVLLSDDWARKLTKTVSQ